jgi:hypothetical protein
LFQVLNLKKELTILDCCIDECFPVFVLKNRCKFHMLKFFIKTRQKTHKIHQKLPQNFTQENYNKRLRIKNYKKIHVKNSRQNTFFFFKKPIPNILLSNKKKLYHIPSLFNFTNIPPTSPKQKAYHILSSFNLTNIPPNSLKQKSYHIPTQLLFFVTPRKKRPKIAAKRRIVPLAKKDQKPFGVIKGTKGENCLFFLPFPLLA